MRQINNLRQTKRLPELLAPAGSFAHLKAAVKAGADAVYMGGQQFGARAYADNFSRDDLVEALHYAHFYDTRLYLTVNTLMKEKELEEVHYGYTCPFYKEKDKKKGKNASIYNKESKERLYDFLYPFYEEGLDGVIVQDIGAAAFIRNHFPQMEIHGSTQMTITDVFGARAAARMGMTRIVPARELSLQELQEIKEDTGLELEVFIHGALCYCYSGQCLLSSAYGGRSGNRGRCAQPCRLPYRLYRSQGKEQNIREITNISGQHLLSPKDLCTLDRLLELIAVGVDSLKIEGRMKNVEYVAGVTATYRKYLDECAHRFAESGVSQSFSEEINGSAVSSRQTSLQEISHSVASISAPKVKKDIHLLEELYSREGFTEGYWTQHNGKNMMATRYPRNLGRKIGQIVSCTGHQISVRLNEGEILHPKDILIVPLEANNKTKELVLTVPENVQRQKSLIVLNIPKTKGLHKGMFVYRRKNEALSQWIQKDILEKELRYPVSGTMRIRVGQPAQLILRCRGDEISVLGDIVQLSQNKPVTREDILRQMNKTGGTPFFLEHLEVELDSDAFFPMSQVKAMRQKALVLLKNTEEDAKKVTKNSLHFPEKNDSVILPNNRNNLESEQMKDLTAYVLSGTRKRVELSENHNFRNHNIPHKMAVVYDQKTLEYCLRDSFFDSICLPYDFWQDVAPDGLKNYLRADLKTDLKNEFRNEFKNDEKKDGLFSTSRAVNDMEKGEKEDSLFSTSRAVNDMKKGEKEDSLFLAASAICDCGKKAYLSLPEVFRSYGRTGSGLEKLRRACQCSLWSGIYANNLGEAEFLWEQGISGIASASFYHWNQKTIDETRSLFGLAAVELPHELSRQECLDLLQGGRFRNLEWTVYGRFPVMRSAQCVKKTAGLCDAKPEILWLEDIKGRKLPVATHCDACYNTIWLDQPVNRIGGDLGELREYIHTFRFHFMETELQEIESVVREFRQWEENQFSHYTSSQIHEKLDEHWIRGVE